MSSQRTSSTLQPSPSLSQDATRTPTSDPTSTTQTPTSSDDTSASSSTTQPATSHKPSSVPVIAGSLVGCIVLVAVILTSVLVNKKRRRLREERFAAESFNSSDSSNTSVVPPGDAAFKVNGLNGPGTQQQPREQETSSSSSTHRPSPDQYQNRSERLNRRHQDHRPPLPPPQHQSSSPPPSSPSSPRSHHHHHKQRSQRGTQQSTTSTSSVQSQTELLSRSSNPAMIPHGREDLDGTASHTIMVNSDVRGVAVVSGRNAGGVPTIVVTRDLEVNGDEEDVGVARFDVDRRGGGGSGPASGRRGLVYERETGVGGAGIGIEYHRDGGGQRRTSRSRGSVSGSEYSYPGYDESGSARRGETVRMHTIVVGDPTTVDHVQSLTPLSTVGRPWTAGSSVTSTSTSLPGSPTSTSHHQFSNPRLVAPPSPTISTASTSVHPLPPQGQTKTQAYDAASITSNPLTRISHSSLSTSQHHHQHHQEQKDSSISQGIAPIPSYSESYLHTFPPTGRQQQQPQQPQQNQGPVPLVARVAIVGRTGMVAVEGDVEEEEAPPAYENVWAATTTQRSQRPETRTQS